MGVVLVNTKEFSFVTDADIQSIEHALKTQLSNIDLYYYFKSNGNFYAVVEKVHSTNINIIE